MKWTGSKVGEKAGEGYRETASPSWVGTIIVVGWCFWEQKERILFISKWKLILGGSLLSTEFAFFFLNLCSTVSLWNMEISRMNMTVVALQEFCLRISNPTCLSKWTDACNSSSWSFAASVAEHWRFTVLTVMSGNLHVTLNWVERTNSEHNTKCCGQLSAFSLLNKTEITAKDWTGKSGIKLSFPDNIGNSSRNRMMKSLLQVKISHDSLLTSELERSAPEESHSLRTIGRCRCKQWPVLDWTNRSLPGSLRHLVLSLARPN